MTVDPVTTAASVTSAKRWRWAAVLTVAIVSHIVLGWNARSPGVLTGQDDAEYILLSRALAQGSYRELWRVDAPIHSQYPPGYPALLAIWHAAAGSSHSARVALSLVLSGATLAMIFGVVRRRLGEGVAAGSVVALAVNPFFVQYAGAVATEMPYMFFSIACLFALTIAEDYRALGSKSRSLGWLAVATAAMIAAGLVRSVGVALLGALVLWLMSTRQWRAALAVLIAGVSTIGVWLLWTIRAPEQFVGRSYVADVMDARGASFPIVLIERAMSNGWVYATESLTWAVAVPTIQGTIADNIAAVLLVGITLLAGLLTFARRWRAAFLYLSVYSLVLLVYRWQTTRFVVPLLIVLVPCMFVGAHSLMHRIRPNWAAPVIVVMTLLLGWGGADRTAVLAAQNNCARTEGIPQPDCVLVPEQVEYFDALRFARSNLPQDAVLLTVKSGALYYYTGLKSISAEGAGTQDPEDFIDFVRGQGARYILLTAVDDVERGRVSPLLLANCERLRLIKTFPPSGLLFTVDDSGVASSGGKSPECEALTTYFDRYAPRS